MQFFEFIGKDGCLGTYMHTMYRRPSGIMGGWKVAKVLDSKETATVGEEARC